MSEFITLSKSDPKFRSYIEGTFSKDYRALPIQSLNVNTASEQVTFQVFPVKEIAPPFLGLHWLQILKARNFLLVAFPILLIFIKNWDQETLRDPVTGTLSALGALFLMIAVNLRDDYLDHLSGLDRLNPKSASHAIQKGWVTAAEVHWWSYVYLALGIVCGLRALWLYPKLILLVGIFTLLGIFGMTSYKAGLKYRRWSEWAVFLLLGPLLTIGIQFSLGNGFDWQAVHIGILTGWISAFYLHLKNFDQLMFNNKAQFQNTLTWLGFERGKWWLFCWWLSFFIGLQAYHSQYSSFFWQCIFLLASGVVLFPFWKEIGFLSSPLGSKMKQVTQVGYKSIFFIMSLWILQALSNLWFGS